MGQKYALVRLPDTIPHLGPVCFTSIRVFRDDRPLTVINYINDRHHGRRFWNLLDLDKGVVLDDLHDCSMANPDKDGPPLTAQDIRDLFKTDVFPHVRDFIVAWRETH